MTALRSLRKRQALPSRIRDGFPNTPAHSLLRIAMNNTRFVTKTLPE